MKHDRGRGTRTNWLLIKHRDGSAREGDADSVLVEDRSIASGRTMAEIAAGKGRGPRAFMLAKAGAPDPAAVWDSSEGLAAKKRGARLQVAVRARKHELRGRMSDILRPCLSLSRPSSAKVLTVLRAERTGFTRSNSTATGFSSGSRTGRPP